MNTPYDPDRGSLEPRPERAPVRGSAPARELDAKGLYLKAWELIAEGNLRELATICDPEFRLTVPGLADASLDAMLKIATEWRRAFSNFGENRDDMTMFFDGDDKLATRDRHTLTHTGPFITPTGEVLPASGHTFTLFGSHFMRVRRDPHARRNLIIRWDIIFDRYSLNEELQRRSQSQPGWSRGAEQGISR